MEKANSNNKLQRHGNAKHVAAINTNATTQDSTGYISPYHRRSETSPKAVNHLLTSMLSEVDDDFIKNTDTDINIVIEEEC